MPELSKPPKPYGSPSRGVCSADVERAADQLLRAGERPTVEKVRATLGTGSPNTINPLLDTWWKRLAARLDAGPAALHRLPESVAHVAESLWMQALEEGRRRAQMELSADKRAVDQVKDSYEVRSHVLTLREGELDSRLRERERAFAELQTQLRTLTTLLQKEQRTRESQARRIAELELALARSTPGKARMPRAARSAIKKPPMRASSKAAKPNVKKPPAAERKKSPKQRRRRRVRFAE